LIFSEGLRVQVAGTTVTNTALASPTTSVEARSATKVAVVTSREDCNASVTHESQDISDLTGASSGLEPSLQASDTIIVKPEPPPQYRMCRAVKTVEALWGEWTVGFRGGPAIAELDSRWGSQWRAGRQNELQWYSLRFEVIKEIRKIARARRCSEEAAMHMVNLQQQRTDCSLDSFCKQLRANRKARTANTM
jgi:hypothetical protein